MLPALAILDLDGTIVDHAGAARRALERWLPSLGAVADGAAVTAWGAVQERHMPAWRTGEISFAEQRRRRLRDFLPLVGLPVPADLDAGFAGYLTEYEAAWAPFDDVAPALALLRHLRVPTAVLTNGTDEQQNAKIDAVGLTGRLGPVFTAEGLGVAKPDPRAFLAVCERLGVAPFDAVNIGDRHDLDVVGARAAGLRAIHVDRDDAGPFGDPDRITSLSALGERLRSR